jgi:hypothetical protein
MNVVMKVLDEELRQGALSIGIGAAYMATGLTRYEGAADGGAVWSPRLGAYSLSPQRRNAESRQNTAYGPRAGRL